MSANNIALTRVSHVKYCWVHLRLHVFILDYISEIHTKYCCIFCCLDVWDVFITSGFMLYFLLCFMVKTVKHALCSTDLLGRKILFVFFPIKIHQNWSRSNIAGIHPAHFICKMHKFSWAPAAVGAYENMCLLLAICVIDIHKWRYLKLLRQRTPQKSWQSSEKFPLVLTIKGAHHLMFLTAKGLGLLLIKKYFYRAGHFAAEAPFFTLD